MTMKEYLDNFSYELNMLRSDNLVLGGSNALLAHGLNLGSWKPDDLDVIIFSPTDSQVSFVKTKFEQCLDEYLAEYLTPHSYRLLKNGLVLNVIFEYKIPTPTDLLCFKYGSDLYQVNTITNIIEAKKSYLRAKDDLHLSLLQDNFKTNSNQEVFL